MSIESRDSSHERFSATGIMAFLMAWEEFFYALILTKCYGNC